jgi:hypothetical protein
LDGLFKELYRRRTKKCATFIGKLLKNNDFSLLNEALEVAASHGHPSADEIEHCFYSILHQTNTHASIEPTIAIPSMPSATRGLSHYNPFFQDGGISS